MSPNARLWTVAIATGVMGVLIGGVAIYGLQPRKTTPAPIDSTRLDALQTQLDQKDTLIATLTDRLNSSANSATVAPTGTPGATAGTGKVRQFSFVKKVALAGGKMTITADYAQFLTGKAAADAATANNDESPPPNDYYIDNYNQELRTLSVKPGIGVKLTSRDDGTSEPSGYKVSLATWAGYYASPSDDNSSITQGPYWLTVTDGIVTAIEEQFTP